MKLQFVEIAGVIFHNGKNYREKIFADPETQIERISENVDGQIFLFVKLTHKGLYTKIPMTAVKHFTEADQMKKAPENLHHTQDIQAFQGAQVETPHSHVFEGRGKGRGGNKPARAQGE